MKQLFYRFLMLISIVSLCALAPSCNKSGCPASQQLQNETMGGPSKKKSKAPKNQSGIIPQGKDAKRY